ncbi:hypothetical protein [Legionella impletisoli]|uniref:Rpn family recombination-promoting nuclease/putative transposase n=2 Tax=Legionella impletisoli TaxID=343510 RepID=A0A917JQW0_9GAMM|nr:hypothetical protein [Legionella impletisoli]GGI81988.1 hypothetical protein GCM10007966_08180 [Legionella impletisoli]
MEVKTNSNLVEEYMNGSHFILKPSRFLSPKKDMVFRRIFGANPELILSIINNILPFKIPIFSIDYISENQIPHFNIQNHSSVHIRCVDMMEKVLFVSLYFIRRSVPSDCIASNKPLAAYLKKYLKNINETPLYPHYTLFIWDAILFDNITDWFHYGGLVESIKPEIEPSQHELYVIELEKFNLNHQVDKVHVSMGELWLRFFNEIHEDTYEFPPLYMNEPVFLQAMSLAQELNFYDDLAEATNYQSNANSIQINSIQKHLDEAKIKGQLEGEKKARMVIAKKMVAESIDPNMISQLTGLSHLEIDSLTHKLAYCADSLI